MYELGGENFALKLERVSSNCLNIMNTRNLSS